MTGISQTVRGQVGGGAGAAVASFMPRGNPEIVLEDIKVLDMLPETVFTSTSPVSEPAAAAPQTASSQ